MVDQVEEIKQKTDIVSLISEFVELKKAGRNYRALCPFHSEKTPSFMVSPELQIFKCFGCGEGGDVYAFLQKYEGMDFWESLKFLAERAGVKLKPIKPGLMSEREKIYEVNSLATYFYHYLLTKHDVGKKALSYLKEKRKLKKDTIETFQLGYSPDKPLTLKKYLVEKKKIDLNDLEKAGIVYKRGGQAVDRFRGRIIFPLHDHRGNIVGFAGRILPGERTDLAKYINTPETPAYSKSKLLYGLNVSRSSIKKAKGAVVVEGELDMISSWQTGFKNTVAIKGSALTQEQVKLLSRYTDSLVLAMDADIAGDTAAKRGIEIAEREGFEIKVVKLSGFKDPDEAARKAPDKLKKAIEKASSVWDFIIDSVLSKYKKIDGAAKAKISKELIPSLALISDKIVQAHYIGVVAKKLGVSEEAVAQQVINKPDLKRQPSKRPVQELTNEATKGRRELLEERLLAVCFRHDPKALLERQIKTQVSTPLAKRILEELRSFFKKHKSFDPSEFASELPRELVEGFTKLVLKDIKGLEDAREEVYKKEIDLIKRELSILAIKEKLEKTGQLIGDLEKRGKRKALREAEKKFGELTKTLTELEEENFRGIIL